MRRLALLLLAVPLVAHAGGSNYGITPGTHPDLAGKVREWAVPTPRLCSTARPVSVGVSMRQIRLAVFANDGTKADR